jgi:hypothetical protein
MAQETTEPSAPLWLPDAAPSTVIARRHPAVQLAGPFAAVGLVGGALTGSLASQEKVMTAFALVTMLTAGVLGAYHTHRKRVVGELTSSRLLGSTMIAGCVNGALLLLPMQFPAGCLAGVIAGLMFSIPFMPTLLLVARWGDDVGFALRGSLVDRAYRRSPIAAAALVIALSTLFLFIGQWGETALLTFRVAFALAFATLALVVLADLRARAVASKAARLQSTATAPMGLELGVGDDVTIDAASLSLAYRGVAPKIRICGGDPALAHDRLRAPLVRHLLALAAVILVLIAHATGRAQHRSTGNYYRLSRITNAVSRGYT